MGGVPSVPVDEIKTTTIDVFKAFMYVYITLLDWSLEQQAMMVSLSLLHFATMQPELHQGLRC